MSASYLSLSLFFLFGEELWCLVSIPHSCFFFYFRWKFLMSGNLFSILDWWICQKENRFCCTKTFLLTFSFDWKYVAARTSLARILQSMTASHHTMVQNPQVVEAAAVLQASKFAPKFRLATLRLGRSLISSTFWNLEVQGGWFVRWSSHRKEKLPMACLWTTQRWRNLSRLLLDIQFWGTKHLGGMSICSAGVWISMVVWQ